MAALAAAMPQAHRDFLAALPWGLEAAGHLFVHCGLSRAVALPAAEQARRLLAGRWEASSFRPGPLARAGSFGGGPAPGDYPAWLGADRDASGNPLPLFGKVQVTGHVRVERPQADAVRIRIDTTGGREGPLTAAVLASPSARPAFVQAAPPKPARPAWGGEPGDADEPPRRAAWRPWREAWRGW
jgi:serine/threonine protein phosphatase 1